ncbi:hypothetical protein [Actinomadura atramentaria]|uniref:hypothetical protein n=1 Tax=Actinomadura atramentaria TaxID=1990 RepID=UPI00036FFA98|nr:hypothetical protein [Actinomadura atramentaria]
MLETLYYELSIAAARQSGLVTRAQVARLSADAAVIDRLKEAKLLRELDDDVFELPSSRNSPTYAYPYAAWLALAPDRFRWERPEDPTRDAVLSHHSAARVHGLGALPVLRTAFTAPEEIPAPRGAVVHAGRLAPEDVTVVRGIPVTTPHRTILDLVRFPFNDEEIGRVLQDALRKDVIDLAAIIDAMAPLAAEYGFPADGAAMLRRFLPDLVPSSLSPHNLRTYAKLVSPDDIAVIKTRIAEALSIVPSAAEVMETLSEDVAADIVGRLRWP